jgi:hypothetical protein
MKELFQGESTISLEAAVLKVPQCGTLPLPLICQGIVAAVEYCMIGDGSLSQ